MLKYNFKKVFKIFKDSYKPIPLEVYGTDPYRTLISTLLSSRTNDDTTLKASNRLFSKASNIKILRYMDIKLIEKLIYPVGFYKTKARQLQKLAGMIITDYKGRIPTDRDLLMKLPGVGRKTANLVLNRAFGIPAIAVDTHVHKICNLLGWVKTNSPGQTEIELTKILPKKYLKDINRLFVFIGRQYNTDKKLISFLKEEGLFSTP